MVKLTQCNHPPLLCHEWKITKTCPTGVSRYATQICNSYNRVNCCLLDLPSTAAVSVIDPFYDSSYWNLEYDPLAMQQVPMVETNYGGKLYSPSDEVETIAGHVFKSPKPPRAQHGKRQCQQQSTAAITGGSGVGIDGNGIQRQSSFLLKRLDAKKSMAEISIPGMRAVFGLRSSMIRRIIWIFILITCFSICAIQVQDRVVTYMSSPVTVHVRVSRNMSLRFPVLSICNKNMFNMSAIQILKEKKANAIKEKNGTIVSQKEMAKWDVGDLIGVNDYNVSQLWDFISHSLNKDGIHHGMALECYFGRNKTCEERGRWEVIYNYMGVCYSYTLNGSLVNTTGLFNNFYLKLQDTQPLAYKDDASGWKLLIHDQRDSPLIHLRTHGTTLYRGWSKDIRVFIRQFQTINSDKRPCSDEIDYSYSECVANCFIKEVNANSICRLPYIKALKDDDPEPCNDSQAYAAVNKRVDDLLFYGEWSENNCPCPRQCNQDFYITYAETNQMDKEQENKGKLRIFYQDLTYDDIEEEFGYTTIPLLCDIGGSLGLLLGASVLTFFEIIEAISTALVHLTAMFTHCCCLFVKSKPEPRPI
ncbi:acid-sensing ion channel 5-like isoform X2 [Daphnia pulicaria]|uniref:acid-sensing ion channel 5-like isoform X2 n=1 Tax=Daphnia pulicaria TaxID=35523 RepID=UPI001EEAB5F9|nr:acid-sensing ion channel 5-like isoform X2 [Daphnia pulicaria]XP_046644343.1 acid-sensing ion channel 5-like isoform X2 [Daphnia pulicaria]